MNRRAEHGRPLGSAQSLALQFDEFAWSAIGEQSAQLGVSREELATFAILYYLADVDSGRIARQVPPAEQLKPASRSASGAQ